MTMLAPTAHPVLKLPPMEQLRAMGPVKGAEYLTRREQTIRLSKEDPFYYGFEPEMWRETDVQMAKKRLAHPGVQLELLVLGGIRSGKTDFAGKRGDQHFFYTNNAWCWGLHETDRSSAAIQQSRLYKYAPAEFKTDTGKLKRSKTTHFSYSEGSGFTENFFNLRWKQPGAVDDLGGLFEFKFYKSSLTTLQGAELTFAWSDELVPRAFVSTVRERLLSRAADTRTPEHLRMMRDCIEILQSGKPLPPEMRAKIYHGVHIITFTPKEGYSPTVADFLDGAVTTKEVDAELLPIYGPGYGDGINTIVGYKKVPRFKQPAKPTRLVAYWHTYDNVFAGNWEGMKEDCKGRSEDDIRIIAYGDVKKSWTTAYPKFNDTVHVVPLSKVPKKGTFYQVVDPCSGRNWFMIWAMIDVTGKSWIIREWPQLGDYIPGQGDPGEWALASETNKRDGDQGPAQQGFGFGFEDYKKEIERVEKELGEHFNPGSLMPIHVTERRMDSRYGNSPTPTAEGTTTIIEQMEDIGVDFLAAPGDRLHEGDTYINNALAYNQNEPVTPLNCPKMFIVDTCKATIFAAKNYSGADGTTGACKDPRDCMAYLHLSEPEYAEGVKVRKKASPY